MQGGKLTEQPIQNDKGILLFNGDIFDYTWDKTIGDTQIIMNKLTEVNSNKTCKL